jgi:uncharacterized protein YciI
MTARLSVVALLLIGMTASFVIAEDAPGQDAEYEMTTYQLVFLLDDPDFEEDPMIAEAHAAHRSDRFKTVGRLYLTNLVRDGVALIAGPLQDHEQIRYVAVLAVETTRDAEMVFDHAPDIESGRAELEIYPWWAAKDILQKPEEPEKTVTATLGLLKRPSGAPDYPTEELERIQAGHLENIRKMADSGELVIAGPVERGGDLRGILIFRTGDADRIEELVAEDPAIQAGRLVLELHRWTVPKQCFPES